jgi:hypothetical protein
MFDKARDARHVKKLLQIKLRDNQYLPNIKIKAPQKKLNKSKSQLLNLSHEIATNRKHLNSVNKALHKSKPVDYYDNGKYIYEKNIERYQKLFMDNLKNKNEKLEKKYKNLQKKMVKIPVYILNGKRNKKKLSKKIKKNEENEEKKKDENKEDENNNNENNDNENNDNENNDNEENEQENEEEENEEYDNRNRYVINERSARKQYRRNYDEGDEEED